MESTTFAQQCRADLIKQLQLGEQPILDTFLHKHMFPDITVAEWMHSFGIQSRVMYIGDYKFYVFSFIPEEEF